MSWEQLRAITQENKTTKRIEDSQPPVACPVNVTVSWVVLAEGTTVSDAVFSNLQTAFEG